MRTPRIAAILLAATPTLAQATVTTQGNFRVEYAGTSIGTHPDVDSAIESWMSANGIHST